MRPSPLSVVIVNWNGGEYLLRAVRAVLREDVQPPPEVWVVDNASTDGSPERVEAWFPQVHLLRLPENRGYGGGANAGAARTHSPFLLVLNADAEVQPGSLRAWMDFLRTHPRAGLCGGLLYDAKGRIQPSHLAVPSLLSEAWEKGVRRYLPTRWHRRWLRWRYRRPVRLSVVGGTALCFRRAAFDAIGGFDEGFFLYFEEADVCLRLRRRGWEVWLVPEARIVHHGGRSTKQVPTLAREHGWRSRLRFYRKHRPRWEQAFVEWYGARRRRRLGARRDSPSAAPIR